MIADRYFDLSDFRFPLNRDLTPRMVGVSSHPVG